MWRWHVSRDSIPRSAGRAIPRALADEMALTRESSSDSGATGLALGLTPSGTLALRAAPDADPLEPAAAARIAAAFAGGAGHGLLHLGAAEVDTPLPPGFAFWRDLRARLRHRALRRAGARGDAASAASPVARGRARGARRGRAADARAASTSTPPRSRALLGGDERGVPRRAGRVRGPLEAFLRARHPAWNLVGRVHFHLAENKRRSRARRSRSSRPTRTRLAGRASAQHRAARRGAPRVRGRGQPRRAPRAARARCSARPSGARSLQASWSTRATSFSRSRWTPDEAYRVPPRGPRASRQRASSCACPTGGRAKRAAAAAGAGHRRRARAGRARHGRDARLLRRVTLDGETLTAAEIAQRRLDGTGGPRAAPGQVGRGRSRRASTRCSSTGSDVEAAAGEDGLSFLEGMRLLAGRRGAARTPPRRRRRPRRGREVIGRGLARGGARRAARPRGARRRGDCRRGAPRRRCGRTSAVGVRWLSLLQRLGLGACLADDMGLGKTVQVLALLLALKERARQTPGPHLLVVPASLIANWKAEIERFAPSLRVARRPPVARRTSRWPTSRPDDLAGADLVITTLRHCSPRCRWLARARVAARRPRRGAGDQEPRREADARRQGAPGAEPRRADRHAGREPPRAISGRSSTSSTPACSAPAKAFARVRQAARRARGAGVRAAPRAGAALHPAPAEDRQARHRRPARQDRGERVLRAQPRRRRRSTRRRSTSSRDKLETRRRRASSGAGVVLAYLMRLQADLQSPVAVARRRRVRARGQSGKFARLRELVRGDRRAAGEGARLHAVPRDDRAAGALPRGGVRPARARAARRDAGRRAPRARASASRTTSASPFFVLSLKAGGTGLNLTAASHVIHFDRWWNPAVENQATDRAFRIGQKRNVLVHKFVCRGTVEERIDAMIEAKQRPGARGARGRRRGAAHRDERRRAARARVARPARARSRRPEQELKLRARTGADGRRTGYDDGFPATCRSRSGASNAARHAAAAREEGARARAGGRGARRAIADDLLGQGLVRQPRAPTRLREPPAAGPDLRARRSVIDLQILRRRGDARS